MNRGRIEIIAHILTFCVEPRLKTQIMYNANITFRQFETYATFLSAQGLLSQKSQKYVATEKGHRFVKAFSQMQSTLEGVPAAMLATGFPHKTGKNKTMVEGADQNNSTASEW